MEEYIAVRPHYIKTPSFLPEDGRELHYTAIWWWFCRIRIWRYKLNRNTGVLIQKNNYTRDSDFK